MTEHERQAAPTNRLRAVPVASAGGSGNGLRDARLRWVPLRLVMFGIAMFAVGTVLLLVWADALAQPESYGQLHALALTHIFSLGFVTSLVIAVLYQFIPANFHANVRGLRRAQAVAGGYALSVLLFTAALSTGALLAAAIAGPLLALSAALFLSQMASVVVRAKRRSVVGGFHITAFVALTGVIVLGSLLATSLPNAWIGDPRRWLAAKIVLAVAGWLGMILVGVSYHTVRGLNGSSAQPRLVVPTLCVAVGGVAAAPVTLLLDAPTAVQCGAMSLLLIASSLSWLDVLYLIRKRASTATTISWVGHLIASTLLVLTACEGVLAMVSGLVWSAAAVCGFLLGVAPMAIVANGNRIIPILIANRYNGRGRNPLSASRLGRVAMPAAVAALVLSWVTLQGGILQGNVVVIRIGALLLAATAACLGATVVRQAMSARKEARHPEWAVVSTDHP